MCLGHNHHIKQWYFRINISKNSKNVFYQSWKLTTKRLKEKKQQWISLNININLYNYKDYFNRTKISFKPFYKKWENTLSKCVNSIMKIIIIIKIIFFDHKRRIPKYFFVLHIHPQSWKVISIFLIIRNNYYHYYYYFFWKKKEKEKTKENLNMAERQNDSVLINL